MVDVGVIQYTSSSTVGRVSVKVTQPTYIQAGTILNVHEVL